MGILGVVVAIPKADAAPVTIALVQDSSQATALTSSLSLTLPHAVHAGDDLFASFNNTHDLLTITSISGGGVTWVRANQENDNQVGDSEIWYGLGATAGPATVTVNLSGNTDQQFPYYALNISEWSGVGGLDRAPAGTAQHEQSTVAVAPAITPTTSGDLFIGVNGSYASCIASGPPGGGFTSFPIETGLPNQGIQHTGYGYLVATNANTQQYSQPLLAEYPCDWAATAAAFYPQSLPTPSVTGLSPTTGPTTGGTPVTITGSNLAGATSVLFGSAPATSFTVNGNGTISAIAPAATSGTVDVTISTPGGTSATSSADQFRYQTVPTVPIVSGISPTTGPTTGGTPVTITGSNFTGTTSVLFGTVSASSFTVRSSTEITAVSPAEAAGAQIIHVTTGGGSNAAQTIAFTFTSPAPPTTSSTSTPTTSCDGTLAPGSVIGMAAIPGDDGYWVANNQGRVVACGNAHDLGGLPGAPTHPVVGIAATADGGGYYLVASDGGVFAFGDARFYGSTGAVKLNKPIVGMAVDPATGGYWLVATDGGVFSFNAPFFGSTGNISLNKPVAGMAAANGGSGYWLVASDGGIFSFNAPFLGSMGSTVLNKPIIGMSPDSTSGGYWLVASDGGIFSFDAPFLGSTGGLALNKPIVGMEPSSSGSGYRFVASDGGIFAFGSSQFYGSAG